MNEISKETEKLYFNFFRYERPDLLEKIQENFFKDKDIQDVFLIYKEHYIKFGKTPEISFLNAEIERNGLNIKPSFLKMLLMDFDDWKNEYSGKEEYYEVNIDKYNRKLFDKNKILRGIDLVKFSDKPEYQEKYDSRKLDELYSVEYINLFEVEEEEEEEETPLRDTPLIESKVYDILPNFLKKSCKYFEDRERDIFFTGELVVLSSLFKNVSGIYFHKPIYPNLYAFVSTPSSNGKGVISFSSDTLFKYKEYEMEDNKREKKKLSEKEQKDFVDKRLIIPGNASVASFIDNLKNNDGVGLVMENEADTITNNKKQDWGNYDDVLRKAFHHEDVSSSRKNERFYVYKPKLSLITTGTLAQLFKFIPNTENGLFSRFIYYTFQQELKFKNPFENALNYENIFMSELSQELLDIFHYFDRWDNNKLPITYTFEYTDEQKKYFYIDYQVKLKRALSFTIGNDIQSAVNRLALINFRISMILSILRRYDNRSLFNDDDRLIICDDIDFYNAISITEVYIEHMKLVYSNMPLDEHKMIRENNIDKVFNKLPTIFTRRILFNKGAEFGMSMASCKKYLSRWIKNEDVKKDGQSNYLKILKVRKG